MPPGNDAQQIAMGVFENKLPIEPYLLQTFYLRGLNPLNESVRIPAESITGGDIIRIGSVNLVGGVETVIPLPRPYPDISYVVPSVQGVTARNNLTGVLMISQTINNFTVKAALDCTYVWVAIRDNWIAP